MQSHRYFKGVVITARILCYADLPPRPAILAASFSSLCAFSWQREILLMIGGLRDGFLTRQAHLSVKSGLKMEMNSRWVSSLSQRTPAVPLSFYYYYFFC